MYLLFMHFIDGIVVLDFTDKPLFFQACSITRSKGLFFIFVLCYDSTDFNLLVPFNSEASVVDCSALWKGLHLILDARE